MGQLTGGIAHDFNNLMMIVGGQAEMLGKRLGEPRDVRAVEAIRTAVGRGESLTRQLLAFSRTTALRSEVLAIGERVAQFRDMIASPLPGNIKLVIDIPKDIWNVEARCGRARIRAHQYRGQCPRCDAGWRRHLDHRREPDPRRSVRSRRA